jgi:galactoside O-acetyltransferase
MKGTDNIFFDLSELAYLGEHAIVGKTVRIRKPDRSSIGTGSIIDDFCYISCRLTVGDYCHIGTSTSIIGGDALVTMGDFVNIGNGCRLIAATNDLRGGGLVGSAIPAEYAAEAELADVTIADHVAIATNSVVLPGCRIPEGLATGAMTLLSPKMKLEPWTLYVGVPARPIGPRDPTEILAAAERLRLGMNGR